VSGIVLATLTGIAALAVVTGVIRRRLPRAFQQFGLLAGLLLPLAGTADAAWQLRYGWVGWRPVAIFLVFFVATSLGVTIGYHRLLTHRSFEAGPLVTGVLLALGAMSLGSRPLDFAAHHLKHHAHSDAKGDPHSPREGLLHAHVGWFLARDLVAERGRYCAHLRNDAAVAFVERTTYIWFALGLFAPFLLGGWDGLLWGSYVRIALANNLTFAANSIGHRFGSQPFATRDESRNNTLLALLNFGEWHNNHHAFPSAAYQGFGWRQPDVSGAIIILLARLRLARNVKTASATVVARRREAGESAPA
jgi:stearoyl-CoA desaturase (delta-9 desaturase)